MNEKDKRREEKKRDNINWQFSKKLKPVYFCMMYICTTLERRSLLVSVSVNVIQTIFFLSSRLFFFFSRSLFLSFLWHLQSIVFFLIFVVFGYTADSEFLIYLSSSYCCCFFVVVWCQKVFCSLCDCVNDLIFSQLLRTILSLDPLLVNVQSTIIARR